MAALWPPGTTRSKVEFTRSRATHTLNVYQYSDWRGTRFGADTGMLASKGSRAFRHYLEAGCTDWRSGFVVFTFCAGHLMCPEPVLVIHESPIPGCGKVFFRGKAVAC